MSELNTVNIHFINSTVICIRGGNVFIQTLSGEDEEELTAAHPALLSSAASSGKTSEQHQLVAWPANCSVFMVTDRLCRVIQTFLVLVVFIPPGLCTLRWTSLNTSTCLSLYREFEAVSRWKLSDRLQDSFSWLSQIIWLLQMFTLLMLTWRRSLFLEDVDAGRETKTIRTESVKWDWTNMFVFLCWRLAVFSLVSLRLSWINAYIITQTHKTSWCEHLVKNRKCIVMFSVWLQLQMWLYFIQIRSVSCLSVCEALRWRLLLSVFPLCQLVVTVEEKFPFLHVANVSASLAEM